MAFVRRPAMLLTLVGAAAIGPYSACGFPDYTFRPLGDEVTTDASAGDGSGGNGAIPSSTGGTAGTGAGGSNGGAPMQPDAAADALADGAGGGGPVFECTVHQDCTADARRPACDVATNRCVECLPSFACPAGLYCTLSKRCEIGCANDIDCSAGGPVPAPDAASPVEAGAALDGGGADASDGALPIVLDGGAVECRQNQCVGCTGDSDCPEGTLCDLGRCVNGCTPAHPCPSGFTCCNGTCADLTDDVDHCGSCDEPCAPPGAVGECIDSTCTLADCEPEFEDCNGVPSDGCEIHVPTDPDHCGSCGNVCPFPDNGLALCREGACGLGECLPGFENCNDQYTDGCEVYLPSNPAHCGACNFQCQLDNASPRCESGSCQIASCLDNHDDCDNSPVNGCETSILSDPNNCGECTVTCSLPNANVGCSVFECTVTSCEAPSANCDGRADNGCEVDTSTNVAHCGACDDPCILAHATATCSGGACAIESCDAGWEDCNGQPGDGCETSTNGDENNCGACGFTCSSNNGTPLCALGACSITCSPNYDDCDNDPLTGCETDLRTSVDHCAFCDNACPAGAGETANCVSGICGISSCGANAADCDGNPSNGCEVATNDDIFNCGGCGKTCFAPHGTAACTAGTCTVPACEPGWGNCDGIASNGCEARLNTSSNCGACNSPCALANAAASCSTGTCEVSFCMAPYANCDGQKGNGCEVNTLDSLLHCGACLNACSTNHGSPTCSNGSCTITCDSGFGNCNASASDGCETPTTDDVQNCGGCGDVCAVQHGQPGCSGTTCTVASCTAPFADCDGTYATGCETNTSDNESDCGSCSTPCNLPNAVSSCVSSACVIDACFATFEDCDGVSSNGCEESACP